MIDADEYENNPRVYALELLDAHYVTAEQLARVALNWLSYDECKAMLDASELSPRFFQE